MDSAKGLEKVQAGSLVKGSYVMIGGKPCRVISTSKAKPGKHGSAKAIIVAVGILDDKKVEKSFGTSDLIDAPILKRTEYPLLNVDEEFLELQMESGDVRSDIKFSEQESLKEVNDNIMKYFESETPCLVTILSVCGIEVPCAVREDSS